MIKSQNGQVLLYGDDIEQIADFAVIVEKLINDGVVSDFEEVKKIIGRVEKASRVSTEERLWQAYKYDAKGTEKIGELMQEMKGVEDGKL